MNVQTYHDDFKHGDLMLKIFFADLGESNLKSCNQLLNNQSARKAET